MKNKLLKTIKLLAYWSMVALFAAFVMTCVGLLTALLEHYGLHVQYIFYLGAGVGVALGAAVVAINRALDVTKQGGEVSELRTLCKNQGEMLDELSMPLPRSVDVTQFVEGGQLYASLPDGRLYRCKLTANVPKWELVTLPPFPAKEAR